MFRAGIFYAGWYPRLWFGKGYLPGFREFGALAPHLRFVERSSRKVARMLLYAILRYGPKLERRQMMLFRFVDVGAELFAMTASYVRAAMLLRKGQDGPEAVRLADHFCVLSRRRIEGIFRTIFHNTDRATYSLAQEVLQGKHTWLESGILDLRQKMEAVPGMVPEPVVVVSRNPGLQDQPQV